MKNTKICQNWYSYVGFEGKKEDGYTCPEGKESVATDYVELRIDPKEGSPLYDIIEYKEADWMEDNPDAEPFIEKDGKHHGNYHTKDSVWTMDESIDRIIAYVHFTHNTNEFNTVFFEVGNVESRESVDIKHFLSEEEFKEIINFAENCMRNDFFKLGENARWEYAEDAEELGLIDVEENSPRKWKGLTSAEYLVSVCEHKPFQMEYCRDNECAGKHRSLCACYDNPLNCFGFYHKNIETMKALGLFVCDEEEASEELSLSDIISNMRDELERAYALLKDNEDAKEGMLLSDIEASLERSVDYLTDSDSLPKQPKEYLFRYYWYDSNRGERTVGLIYAADQKDARKKLAKKYPSIMPAVWDISEENFSEDGNIEVYYG